MILFLLIIIVLIIGLYYFTSKEDEDIDRCYTDFLLANDPEYIERLKLGNWVQNTDDGIYRAIGTSRLAYNPGDDVYISVTGSPDFIDTVTKTIKTYAQPFVNLNFIFTTDTTKSNFKIESGKPPEGYTGWCNGIGIKNVYITLGNQRQMNILHELGHALGLMHENQNQSSSAVGSSGGNNVTQFDIKSIMGVPSGGFQTQRTSEYSDLDKLWFKKSYGEPGSGKNGKRDW